MVSRSMITEEFKVLELQIFCMVDGKSMKVTDEFKILEVQLALEGRTYGRTAFKDDDSPYACPYNDHTDGEWVIVIAEHFPDSYAVVCKKHLHWFFEYGANGWKVYEGG